MHFWCSGSNFYAEEKIRFNKFPFVIKCRRLAHGWLHELNRIRQIDHKTNQRSPRRSPFARQITRLLFNELNPLYACRVGGFYSTRVNYGVHNTPAKKLWRNSIPRITRLEWQSGAGLRRVIEFIKSIVMIWSGARIS